jgi:hypothetical protein
MHSKYHGFRMLGTAYLELSEEVVDLHWSDKAADQEILEKFSILQDQVLGEVS